MRKLFVVLLVIFAVTALTACGGGGDAADGGSDSSVGDVRNGERLFAQATIGATNAPGCITCHALDGTDGTGPSQHDVGVRAVGRIAGVSAEEYLRQSIVEPNAYIVEGYEAGVMHQTYGEDLTESEINDLVAYLLTLDG